MKQEQFEQIMCAIDKFNGISRDCAYMLIKKFDRVSPNTLHSILSEAVITVVKQSRRKIHGPQNLVNYTKAVNRGEPHGIIVRMACKMSIPPTMLARSILGDYYKKQDSEVSKSTVNSCMLDTTKINDSRLAHEIYMCILYDDRYGYIADSFSKCSGQQYENKLKRYLNERKIPFSDEVELRNKGYDKTPDVKLELPISVDGFIINWIESKARFGSEKVHETCAKEQYYSYWNRFGPGLVIYWFDFIDTLAKPTETRFIIMNHFPENIVYMDAMKQGSRVHNSRA